LKIEPIKEEEIELKAKKITRYWWHISRALQKCNQWVWSSIMTSDAMKAANSIGIASVAGFVSDQFGCLT
jgi:hypothetical protein